MNYCRQVVSTALLCELLSVHCAGQIRERVIEQCAQDGIRFYGIDDSSFGSGDRPQRGKPVHVSEDGADLIVDWSPDMTKLDLSFGGRHLTETVRGLDPTLGYMAVSKRGVALSWSPNSHAWTTSLFLQGSDGNLSEDKSLIMSAESGFAKDAATVCKEPGIETLAIKWIDDDRLLLAIDAWRTGTCESRLRKASS